jgi:acetylornithine deacetylase
MAIDPFSGEVRDGRLYGRGAYDMKAGVAAIMTAAAELARTNSLKGTLLVALLSDEEYASVGAQDFVRRHQADGCLLAEPTDGAFVTGHRGFAWVDVTVKGLAAHGSRWDLGISANTMAGRFLGALDHHDLTVLRPHRHPLLGPASVHPAIVRGGVGLSTYAPECLVQLEWRILPGTTEADVLAWTHELVRQADIEATVACSLFRPPMLCPSDAQIRQATLGAIGHDLPEQGAPFWMDAAFFDAAGIPTVVYGPTGEGAHAAVEWVDVASVIDCTEIYHRTVRLFCG